MKLEAGRLSATNVESYENSGESERKVLEGEELDEVRGERRV